MYNVSTEYKEEIQKLVRNPSYVKVKFAIIDPQAKASATLTDGVETPFSDVGVIQDYEYIPRTYDTLEHNRFILDKTHILATESYGDFQGYVSGAVSDADGVYAVPPVLTVDFGASYFSFAGLSFLFDEVRGEFAREITVKAYSDVTLVFEETLDITVNNYVHQHTIPTHNKLEISFNKSSLPYKRIRLNQFTLGITKEFTGANLKSTEQIRKVDIISTVLPKGDFNFTFLDINREYDPDNPTGIYSFIESLQPVEFYYGYELDDGTIEWIVGGNNYTTGEISMISNGSLSQVSIKTSNSLVYLSDIYTEGVYSASGTSLYDLAVDVLTDTEIAYELDTSLQSILSKAPLPKLPRRECLQLIANAGKCVLDVDRNGVVKIYDPAFVQDTFSLNFGNSFKAPTVEKYPPLRNLNTSHFNYIPETVISEIVQTDIIAPTDTLFYIEHDTATGTTIAVDGTLTIVGTPLYYAEGCYVTLNGTGTATINGYKINVSENFKSINYNINGEDCDVTNALITTSTDAGLYATWIGDILNLTNNYTIENRGYPELDPTDKIYIDTLFTTALPTIIVEQNLKYSGGFKATTKTIISG